MQGMDQYSGKPLDGIMHLKQSIRDILTTPIGTRVMRRDYGSRIFSLVDNPTNSDFAMELYAATAEALKKWEPRFRLERVHIEDITPDHVTLTLQGYYLPEGKPITLDGIVVS